MRSLALLAQRVRLLLRMTPSPHEESGTKAAWHKSRGQKSRVDKPNVLSFQPYTGSTTLSLTEVFLHFSCIDSRILIHLRSKQTTDFANQENTLMRYGNSTSTVPCTGDVPAQKSGVPARDPPHSKVLPRPSAKPFSTPILCPEILSDAGPIRTSRKTFSNSGWPPLRSS